MSVVKFVHRAYVSRAPLYLAVLICMNSLFLYLMYLFFKTLSGDAILLSPFHRLMQKIHLTKSSHRMKSVNSAAFMQPLIFLQVFYVLAARDSYIGYRCTAFVRVNAYYHLCCHIFYNYSMIVVVSADSQHYYIVVNGECNFGFFCT